MVLSGMKLQWIKDFFVVAIFTSTRINHGIKMMNVTPLLRATVQQRNKQLLTRYRLDYTQLQIWRIMRAVNLPAQG